MALPDDPHQKSVIALARATETLNQAAGTLNQIIRELSVNQVSALTIMQVVKTLNQMTEFLINATEKELKDDNKT